jgi:hypothetical protein
MGMIGAVAQGAVGLFGAASQSADYARAAKQEREQASYNSGIARYNSEVAAQSTQFESESTAQNLRRQKEVVQRNSESKQNALAYQGFQQAGASRAALAASGAESPSAEAGILEEQYKNFLSRQQEQAASDYSSSIFEHQAGQTAESGVITAYNQRQQGLFQSAAISGQGFAKAAEYDQASSNALTQGILGAATTGLSIGASTGLFSGGGLFGGGASPPTSAPAQSSPGLFSPGLTSTYAMANGGSYQTFQPNGNFAPSLLGRQ